MILSKFWSRCELQNFRKLIFLGDDQGELSKGTVPTYPDGTVTSLPRTASLAKERNPAVVHRAGPPQLADRLQLRGAGIDAPSGPSLALVGIEEWRSGPSGARPRASRSPRARAARAAPAMWAGSSHFLCTPDGSERVFISDLFSIQRY